MDPCSIVTSRIESIMSTPPVSIEASEKVSKAVKIMYEANIGSVIVTDNGKIVGMITRKDIVYLTATGVIMKDPTVREVMSTSIVTANKEDSIYDVLKRMKDTGIRHMPILDNGALVGVVSITDIAIHLINKLSESCREPGKPLNPHTSD